MAEINAAIPQQKLEFIRDRIALILAEELSNQAILQDDDLFNAEVWTERFIPFDKEEMPAIDVSYDSTNFNSESPITNRADHEYHIDVITNGKWQDEKDKGDKESALKAQRLAGVVFAILQNPNYIRLGFSGDFGIFNRQVTGIVIGNSANREDAKNNYVARITLSVKVNEDTFELSGVEAEGYDSSFKIGETDKGYKVIINN